MKNFFLFYFLISFCNFGYSQDKKQADSESKSGNLLAELSDAVCKCIDSIPAHIIKSALDYRITNCIDEKAGAYQLGSKILNLDLEAKNPSRKINISMNTDKDSDEYKEYYYDMERYLMVNCEPLKSRLSNSIPASYASMSKNPEALKYYYLALDETKKEDFRKAIDYYEKAVKIDPNFAFAYDNMGLCFRRVNEFDNAIEAYEKSLKIDPNGVMPLQNIAIAYQYKKEYSKAIKTYERLAEIDSKNAEVFYGIGQTYFVYMNECEKGLDNLCKAYNLYVAQKSPYRSDAETLIQRIYAEMNKQDKLAKFNEILKKNNLNPK